MTEDIGLSRRKILGAVGTIGGAAALGGASTLAFFSDEEQMANNQLVAGQLDLKVSWEEHYSDWLGDEQDVDGIRMVSETGDLEDDELGLPSYDEPSLAVPSVDTDDDGVPQIDEFMEATLQERFPDKQTRRLLSQLPPGVDPCEALADVPDDLDLGGQPRPLIDFDDVKPGDFGEVTFDFVLCNNPGYVWLNGGLVDASDNGLTEPERKDVDEQDDVELLDALRAVVWYDDGDNVLEETETYVTDRSVNDQGNPSSSAVALQGDQRIIAEGSLREVLTRLSTGPGIPLDGIPNDDMRDCHTPTPTIHYVGFAWWLPVDHANEIQTDSATFDIGFYTEQCRHNDGVGLSSGLQGYYPLDRDANNVVGGPDGTLVGDVTFGAGQIDGAADFDGDGDYLDFGPAFQFADDEPFSIAGWFNRDAVSGFNDRLLGFDTVNSWGLLFDGGYIDGSQDLVFRYGGTDLPSGVAGNFGTWRHFAVVNDGMGGLSLYVDGTEAASASSASWPTPSQNFIVGNTKRWVDRDNEWFDGQLDDLRIYGRALSGAEITELASQP